MSDRVNHKVIIQKTTQHVYDVEAVSPEEAETIAEDLMKDGEVGTVTLLDTFIYSSFPAEVEEEVII